jgi:hypothetical protein
MVSGGFSTAIHYSLKMALLYKNKVEMYQYLKR